MQNKFRMIPLLALLLTPLAHANTVKAPSNDCYVLDVYGTHKIPLHTINTLYKNEFTDFCHHSFGSLTQKEGESSDSSKRPLATLSEKLHAYGNFSYVGISPIIYSTTNKTYITIDVVEKNDQARQFLFKPTPTKTLPDPDHLISSWLDYENIGFSYFAKNHTFPAFKNCPAHHCIFGFDLPELKQYAPTFNTYVEKDKTQLTDVLRNDIDPIKRRSAAYLLAHIKDVNELITILTPSMQDPDSTVRNAVMRVLGDTLVRSPTVAFPLELIEKPLNYPTTTDRNKALFILTSLAKNPKNKSYIVSHLGKYLLLELHMKQINVRGLAYQVLQELSHQNYADDDYLSWKKWLNDNRGT